MPGSLECPCVSAYSAPGLLWDVSIDLEPDHPTPLVHDPPARRHVLHDSEPEAAFGGTSVERIDDVQVADRRGLLDLDTDDVLGSNAGQHDHVVLAESAVADRIVDAFGSRQANIVRGLLADKVSQPTIERPPRNTTRLWSRAKFAFDLSQ